MATAKKTTRKATPRKNAKKPTAKKKAVARPRSRSGYMDEAMPERAKIEHPGTEAPKATVSGRREGRTSPGQREYGAHYEMVDANTAMERAIKRQNGELPPIEGGLDGDEMTDFDPLSGTEPGPREYDFEPGSDDLQREEQALVERHGVAPAAPSRLVGGPPAPVPNVLDARTRVSLELTDGTMTMPAIDVLPGAYGVTILLPMRDDGVTFIPKPGSSVIITHGDDRWPCYFPGTHFEWIEMKCLGLVFVRADEE